MIAELRAGRHGEAGSRIHPRERPVLVCSPHAGAGLFGAYDGLGAYPEIVRVLLLDGERGRAGEGCGGHYRGQGEKAMKQWLPEWSDAIAVAVVLAAVVAFSLPVSAQLPTPTPVPTPTPTPTPSPDGGSLLSPNASNPTSWADLFRVIGFEGGLVIVLLVVGLVITFMVGTLLYRIANWVLGPAGWGKALGTKWVERQDSFLTKIENCLPALETSNRQQMEFCQHVHAPAGDSNVADLREAGHAAAEAIRSLGKGTNNSSEVDRHADAIHQALRSGTPTTPAAQK